MLVRHVVVKGPLVLAMTLLVAVGGTDAQQPGNILRVGFLANGAAAASPAVDAFRQGLRDLGYVEGRNIALEIRWAEGRFERQSDPLTLLQRQRIADLAARHRLPAMYGFKGFVQAAGLMSYGTMQDDLFRRAAAQVDKVLRGAKPADVPVEQPTRFELVINLKTAKALGLTIPPSILMRAD